jgi:hypothetical protein
MEQPHRELIEVASILRFVTKDRGDLAIGEGRLSIGEIENVENARPIGGETLHELLTPRRGCFELPAFREIPRDCLKTGDLIVLYQNLGVQANPAVARVLAHIKALNLVRLDEQLKSSRIPVGETALTVPDVMSVANSTASPILFVAAGAGAPEDFAAAEVERKLPARENDQHHAQNPRGHEKPAGAPRRCGLVDHAVIEILANDGAKTLNGALQLEARSRCITDAHQLCQLSHRRRGIESRVETRRLLGEHF